MYIAKKPMDYEYIAHKAMPSGQPYVYRKMYNLYATYILKHTIKMHSNLPNTLRSVDYNTRYYDLLMITT